MKKRTTKPIKSDRVAKKATTKKDTVILVIQLPAKDEAEFRRLFCEGFSAKILEKK